MMKYPFRFSLFLFICFSISVTATAQTVDIPDPNLRAAIETALGKAAGDPITTSDMANLTELTARNANISNLTGLEHANNLTGLDLGLDDEWRNSNSVSDISPLAGLTDLTGLGLSGNNISDISPLAGLTKLRWLWLYGNSISDFSPLTRLTDLTGLGLSDNNISDISPLAGLTNLTGLNLSDNNISDISPVAGLTNLTELDLWGNNISDISPVAGLTKLTGLGLSDNNISHISPLAGLTNLTGLNLSDNNISDISPLAGLTKLRWLWLYGNSISDFSPLTRLTDLTGLGLSDNNISDISPLTRLTDLTGLGLSGNNIADISPVAGLTNLTRLNLQHNNISDISPLVENTGLGSGDEVVLNDNPLNASAINTDVPALQSRGVEVWFDLPARPVKSTLTEHTDGVVSVAFSSRGMIASGSNDNTARLWNPVTESTTALLRGHNGVVRSVAFSPDGTTLASGSHDNTIILWDVATQQPKNTLTEHTAPVETVAFSRDGSTLASGSHDGTVILWDVATGQPIALLTGHTSWVWSLAFSPDGTLAIGRHDGTVLLWDVATGKPKDILRGHTGFVEGVAFSPDGSTLASGSIDTTVRLWDVATGQSKAVLTEHTAGINSVAFSPDGTILASGSDDSTVRLWDAVTGQPIALLTGTSWVRSVAFSPDGSTLASGSGDGTIRLWEIAPPPLEFLLSVPQGLNLIHVPLKVTAVDDVAKTIESVSDLYDALGGTSTVNFLITYDTQAQEWRSFFVPSDKGGPADVTLTDDKGIIAGLRTPVSLRLRGGALGTNGTSTITLNQGLNLVGLPLNDSRITRVSDLLALNGISGNVPVIILTDGGEFKLVGRAGDPGDIDISGGQSFILNAGRASTVPISGVGWSNTSGTAAAPPAAMVGIEVDDVTPILALRGSIVDEDSGLSNTNFRVTVKNQSTRRSVTTVTGGERLARSNMWGSAGVGYQLTDVDLKTQRAATIGDILEISAQSSHPLIGVEPLWYTVTAEDVKRSLIQLPELVTYEIPAETVLLYNYPNPFNPETWIPYRLAEDAFVTLTIYDQAGRVVRTLDVGHQVAAVYESRSKAVYWDGRNEVGETVASGVYFYHLSAGDFSATRKMVILK